MTPTVPPREAAKITPVLCGRGNQGSGRQQTGADRCGPTVQMGTGAGVHAVGAEVKGECHCQEPMGTRLSTRPLCVQHLTLLPGVTVPACT